MDQLKQFLSAFRDVWTPPNFQEKKSEGELLDKTEYVRGEKCTAISVFLVDQKRSIRLIVNYQDRLVSSQRATTAPIYFHSTIKEPRWTDNSYLASGQWAYSVSQVRVNLSAIPFSKSRACSVILRPVRN